MVLFEIYKGLFLILAQWQWRPLGRCEMTEKFQGPTPRARQLIWVSFPLNWVAFGKNSTFFATNIDVMLWYLEYLWNTGRGAMSQAAYWVFFSDVLSELFWYTYMYIYWHDKYCFLLFLEYWWNMDQPQRWLAGVSKSFVRNICPCKKKPHKKHPNYKKKLASEPSL